MSLTLQLICVVFSCIFPRLNHSKNWRCCPRRITLTITWQGQSTVLNIFDPIHKSLDSITGWDGSLSLCLQSGHMIRTRWAPVDSWRMGSLVILGSIRVWKSAAWCKPKAVLLFSPLPSPSLKCRFFLSQPNTLSSFSASRHQFLTK